MTDFKAFTLAAGNILNQIATDVLVTCADIGDDDVLIGMDIISKGDFAITNYKGKTIFSFRTPSIAKIDFEE